ncbi:MAG: GHKL domain-containing protein [Muribaculaceae bacterium]|nr:GHKL domain-containing protein [bacterium]MCM1494030.1 GHKL domain-containing protein [Muribaculaceae bacterium]
MHSQVYAVISFFLILVCELFAEKIITMHKNVETAPNFPLMIVPICSIAVIVLLIYSGACASRGVAIVSIGLLVINFLMLYLYNMLLHSISQKFETEMLRQKMQIYANQLGLIAQSEEQVKTLRHDMKHHLNELKLLANRHNVADIQQYIDHMEDYIRNPNEIVASGNMEIDSVLNYMLQKARDELETVIVKVILPEKIKHTFDINVMIGNLLENAIEAARQTKQKYLNVNMALKKGVLKIRIENSFLPAGLVKEGKQENSRFLTTKKANGQHGIGLKSVKKIVETYNGTMEVTSQNELFCVSLILYMSKVENRI